MSDRRLDPAELRARLASNLAESQSRGGAISTMLAAEPSVDREVAEEVAVAAPLYKARDDSPETRRATTSMTRRTDQTTVILKQHRREKGRTTATELRSVVLHRHDADAVLRGYRIPIGLHRQAERAKLMASVSRGSTLYWDEVMQDAIDAIPTDLREVADSLPQRDGRSNPTGATRVLQATIRSDQEMRLRLLRLDLEELTGRAVRLEDIWTWLVRRSNETT